LRIDGSPEAFDEENFPSQAKGRRSAAAFHSEESATIDENWPVSALMPLVMQVLALDALGGLLFIRQRIIQTDGHHVP
jgi:hypothetical protein